MSIDWMALVKVALVSFAFGVGIVAVFSVGIVGTSQAARSDGRRADDDEVAFGGSEGHGRSRGIGLSISAVCFAACVAGVLYGLYLIIPQFH